MLPSRFYDDMFDVFEPASKGMSCDIYEKDGMYHVEMDVPGYKKNEINIECHKGTLTIKAKKEFKKDEHEGKKYLRRERRFNSMATKKNHNSINQLKGLLFNSRERARRSKSNDS